MPNPHQTPARIAAVLRELYVTAVITGIIERDAVEALQAADIEVCPTEQEAREMQPRRISPTPSSARTNGITTKKSSEPSSRSRKAGRKILP